MHLQLLLLITEYLDNPHQTRTRLRTLPGIREFLIGEVFAQMVFLSDDFLVIVARQHENEVKEVRQTRRFWSLAMKLPMELQMLLCNRVFESGRDLVLTKHSEPAFRKLASNNM